jgi:hypothetical protein
VPGFASRQASLFCTSTPLRFGPSNSLCVSTYIILVWNLWTSLPLYVVFLADIPNCC